MVSSMEIVYPLLGVSIFLALMAFSTDEEAATVGAAFTAVMAAILAAFLP